jgi:hypothetical protein
VQVLAGVSVLGRRGRDRKLPADDLQDRHDVRLAAEIEPAGAVGFQHAQWSLGIAKPHDWIDFYRPFTLRGLEQNLRNPMLFLFGEDDIKDAAASSPAFPSSSPHSPATGTSTPSREPRAHPATARSAD